MKEITVLGIGNILMQDEGFGVRVVEGLTQRYAFPDNVQVLDGGTLGMELLRFISGSKRLLIIDAVDGDKSPGDFYQFSHHQVKAYFKQKVSLHELGIQDVLAALEIIEQPISDVTILGVQPAVIDVGLELTEVIKPKVDKAVNQTISILRDWGINCLPLT